MLQATLNTQVAELLANAQAQIPAQTDLEAHAAELAKRVVAYLDAQLKAAITGSKPTASLSLNGIEFPAEVRERMRTFIINSIPDKATINAVGMTLEVNPRESVQSALTPEVFSQLVDRVMPYVGTLEANISSEMRSKATKLIWSTAAVGALTGGLLTYLTIKIIEKRQGR
jgi:hypothetical protein